MENECEICEDKDFYLLLQYAVSNDKCLPHFQVLEDF
jgi:hypothetical protein